MTHKEAIDHAIEVLKWKGTADDLEAAERLAGVGDCVKFAHMMRDVGVAMTGDAERFLTREKAARASK